MPLITAAEALKEPRPKQFLLRLAPSLRQYLEQQASDRGISMTTVIHEALAEHAITRMR